MRQKKLTRDVAAWAIRVKMGRARLWALIEGKEVDAPFYDKVLSGMLNEDAYEIVQGETISVNGVTAGGKNHLKALHSTLKTAGVLRQRNQAGEVDVLFFIDRDDDEYSGRLESSAHVVYTELSDVEAEVMYRTDSAAVLSAVFNVRRQDVAAISLPKMMSDLGSIWSTWIALRLASVACEWSDARFAQPSKINKQVYGPADDSLVAGVCARVEAAVEDWAEHFANASEHVAEMEAGKSLHKLVKGKWIPAYISHELANDFGLAPSGRSVPSRVLMAAAVAAIPHGKGELTYFRDSVARLVA